MGKKCIISKGIEFSDNKSKIEILIIKSNKNISNIKSTKHNFIYLVKEADSGQLIPVRCLLKESNRESDLQQLAQHSPVLKK